MFVIFKSLAWVLALVALAGAEPQVGGLRVANALARGQTLSVQVDGKPWNARGFQSGEVGGTLIVSAGGHRVHFSCDGLKPVELRVAVHARQTLMLVPFAVFDPEDGHWKIRVLKPAMPSGAASRLVSIFSVSAKPSLAVAMNHPDGSWKTLRLERLKPSVALLEQRRGYLPLRADGVRLPSLPVRSKGHHVVIVYDSAEGGLAALNYCDRPWVGVE